MIEKLDLEKVLDSGISEGQGIENKINELVDAVNKHEELFRTLAKKNCTCPEVNGITGAWDCPQHGEMVIV